MQHSIRNATYVFNALRHVASGSLHRDVLIPIEVDARRAMAAREQLLLNPLVPRQRNSPVIGRRGPSVIPTSAIVPAAIVSIIAIAAIPTKEKINLISPLGRVKNTEIVEK